MVCFLKIEIYFDEIEHENEHEIKMKRKKVRIKGKKEEEEIGGTRPLIATHLVGDWTRRDASLKGSSYTIKRKTKRERKKTAKEMRIKVGKATT